MGRLAREILALNAERSREFCAPEARDALTLYRRRHPTKFLVFKCMDGRVNLPQITGAPLGKLHPFRNIGGKFELGDSYLSRLVLEEKSRAMADGRSTIALCTFHYSKGDRHRGCAGHNYDTDAARASTWKLKEGFDDVFGSANPAIASVVVGLETDEDALIFCGKESGDEFSIAEHVNASDADLRRYLSQVYPRLLPEMLTDLAELAIGNRDHVRATRRQERSILDLDHNENIICVGRGFDWLHLVNRALIIGPYDTVTSTWREAVGVAGTIVRSNFTRNPRLRDDGTLLLISAPYTDQSEHGMSIKKATYFARIAEAALAPLREELGLERLVGVTNMQTMAYEPFDL